MSEGNVELARRVADAFSSGGVEAMLAFLPEDVVWVPFPGWIEDTEYQGHDGVRRLMAVWTDYFDDYSFELQELRPAGDSVVVLGEQRGRIKGSDSHVSQPLGFVISDLRDGKIGETRFYMSWAEALEAAGLSESQK